MPDKTKITKPLEGLKGCFVAGGAITSLYTNKTINDFDIYPKNEKALEDAIYWAFDDQGAFNIHASDRALTFKMKNTKDGLEAPNVQIMHFDMFESAYKIFEAFDFTCCMGALDLDTEEFVLHSEFLEHCSQRFLSFNPGTRFPYASAWRVRKYEDRGYTIGRMEFQKILLSCAEKPIQNWEDLKEQLGGVYGEAITIPDGEEFSKEAMWKAINTLSFSKDPCGHASADAAVISVSKREIPIFERDGQIYANFHNGDWTPVQKTPKFPKIVPFEEVLGGLTFFKKVKIRDDHYEAPHQKGFLYKIGEEAVAVGPGLFVYTSLEAARNHYAYDTTTDKHAVIEIKPSSVDDININKAGNPLQNVTLKKGVTIRAVPPEEKSLVPDPLPF